MLGRLGRLLTTDGIERKMADSQPPITLSAKIKNRQIFSSKLARRKTKTKKRATAKKKIIWAIIKTKWWPYLLTRTLVEWPVQEQGVND